MRWPRKFLNLWQVGGFTLNGDRQTIERVEEKWRGVFFGDVPLSLPEFDLRMVWEPARLQHLTILMLYAEAYRGSLDSDHLKAMVKGAILDWIDKNPFLSGFNYRSAMECALRIPVFFYALKILDNLDSGEKNRILETIYQHAWWISRRLSLYSSLGNHTVCECVGLIFAGAIFASTTEGRTWMARALALLWQELHHQILADGGPAEQSFGYLRFILDLYWLVIDFLEKNHLHDCTAWKPRLVMGENFLKDFHDTLKQIPSIGDSDDDDDGYAIAPGIFPRRGEHLKSERTTYYSFPDAGYTVIRGANDAILTFDHGPLGLPPLYNHGHADALSITLSVNGKAILVDPGTYRYNGVPEFRQYFKGTRAHNTVTVDGVDQASQETSFIWSRPFRATLARVVEIGDAVILEGWHDGYKRLKGPVIHHRIVFFLNDRYFLIRDIFVGEGVHDFELNYHLHPAAAVTSQNDWWMIDHDKERVYIKLLNGGIFNLKMGQENPPFGWFSPAYGLKVKSAVLSCLQRGEPGRISFLTAILVNYPAGPEELAKKADYLWTRG